MAAKAMDETDDPFKFSSFFRGQFSLNLQVLLEANLKWPEIKEP